MGDSIFGAFARLGESCRTATWQNHFGAAMCQTCQVRMASHSRVPDGLLCCDKCLTGGKGYGEATEPRLTAEEERFRIEVIRRQVSDRIAAWERWKNRGRQPFGRQVLGPRPSERRGGPASRLGRRGI